MEMKKLTIDVLGILKAQLCIILACSVPLFVERRTCFIIGVEFLHGDDHGQEGNLFGCQAHRLYGCISSVLHS